MCGRTCLTLEPNGIQRACKYIPTKSNGKTAGSGIKKEIKFVKEEVSERKGDVKLEYIEPEWRAEFNCGRKYLPLYNIAPTNITPVLISADHFSDEKSCADVHKRILVPMMWGMIPFWHKGDYRKHGLSTNNCRLEHMLESKLYRGPFHRGQRCVVLCEGFYEWQTTKSAKPSEREAYFLCMPQAENVKIYDKTTWASNNVNLLKMAGLFDVWEDENGDKMFSYSVITFESSKLLNWLHHRMPAILETEEQINDWLDFKRVSDQDALAVLKPCSQLKWHRVSKIVNNVRNNSEKCNMPIELVKSQDSVGVSGNRSILSWLRKHRDDVKELELSDDDECKKNTTNSANKAQSGTSPPKKRQRFCDDKKSVTTSNTSSELSDQG